MSKDVVKKTLVIYGRLLTMRVLSINWFEEKTELALCSIPIGL